jgi:hypothetical protein
MNCPKFGFDISESLRNSYCKNCDWDCNKTQVQSWFTSIKIEVRKEQVINSKPLNEEKVTLLVCPACKEKSLFVYQDNFRVECLNNKCKTYKTIGILVKDKEKTYIQYKTSS